MLFLKHAAFISASGWTQNTERPGDLASASEVQDVVDVHPIILEKPVVGV